MLKIGIIGTGYWGKHHLRILSKLACQIVGIADVDIGKKELADSYGIGFYHDYKKLLKKVDAVTIVTPPQTHYQIARKALLKGKHVLLEKPFVFKSREVKELAKLANSQKLTLMVGHTYLYHPVISRIKDLLEKEEIGNIYYLLLQWLNIGIIRKDVNALWNFAPHPYSILYFLFKKKPTTISCFGKSFIQPGIEDVIFLTLTYPNNVVVQINLSWLHHVKVREVVLVGSKKLVYFNEVESNSPLKIYDKGVTPEEYREALNWENFAQFKSKVRFGNVEIPQIPVVEPLELELKDFIEAVIKKRKVVADIDSALAVVTMLESAQKSLQKGGRVIEIKN